MEETWSFCKTRFGKNQLVSFKGDLQKKPTITHSKYNYSFKKDLWTIFVWNNIWTVFDLTCVTKRCDCIRGCKYVTRIASEIFYKSNDHTCYTITVIIRYFRLSLFHLCSAIYSNVTFDVSASIHLHENRNNCAFNARTAICRYFNKCRRHILKNTEIA